MYHQAGFEVFCGLRDRDLAEALWPEWAVSTSELAKQRRQEMGVSVVCDDDQCFWREATGRCSRDCICVTRFDRCVSFQRRESSGRKEKDSNRIERLQEAKVNDPGCTLVKCADYKDGVCMFDSPVCKYRQDELDPETIRDAERFQWLINQGVAWRDCYNEIWRRGEWLYAMQDARAQIDAAINRTQKATPVI